MRSTFQQLEKSFMDPYRMRPDSYIHVVYSCGVCEVVQFHEALYKYTKSCNFSTQVQSTAAWLWYAMNTLPKPPYYTYAMLAAPVYIYL